jgi:hypothetical protein
MPQSSKPIVDFKGASRNEAGSEVLGRGYMNFSSETPTVDIAISVKPKSELHLSWLSISDKRAGYDGLQRPQARDRPGHLQHIH